MIKEEWHFAQDLKRHTQDGCQLALLMKKSRPHKKLRAIDVGCGDGIIAFEMFRLKRASLMTAIDIHKESVQAAHLNLKKYLSDKTLVLEAVSAQKFFERKSEWDRYERFVINPPFFSQGSGLSNKSGHDQRARHEVSLSLKVWAKGAEKLLRTGGELYCVFPTERMGELLKELSLRKVEPKEIWWLSDDKRRRRFFCRAVRGGKPGLKIHFDFDLKSSRE